jgi:hypothetical protein
MYADEVLEGAEPDSDTDLDVVDQEQFDDAELEDVDTDIDLEVVDQDEGGTGQTPEENAQFKKMRLKAEEQARLKVEAEFGERQAALDQKARDIEEREQEKRVMDSYLSDERVYAKADEEGVSEETAKKLLRLEAEKYIDGEKAKLRARYELIDAQKKLLKNDKHYALLEPEVEAVLKDNPHLDFQTVYYHQKGYRSEELDKQLSTKVEKKTVANIQDRSRRRVGTSEGSGDSNLVASAVLTRKGMEMSNAFGFDPREIAAYVQKKIKKKE